MYAGALLNSYSGCSNDVEIRKTGVSASCAQRNILQDSVKVRITNTDSINQIIASSPGIKMLRDAGINGYVIVEIHLDKRAAYQSHAVLESPHEIATKAVEFAIPYMKFEVNPALSRVEIYTVKYEFVFRN
jgi:hypothetical protein